MRIVKYTTMIVSTKANNSLKKRQINLKCIMNQAKRSMNHLRIKFRSKNSRFSKVIKVKRVKLQLQLRM